MSNDNKEINTRRKDIMIEKLLDRGIYKTGNHQLYELSLKELEHTYQKLAQAN
ncbi:Fur-regulated basic protein FbpA [Sporolactobacillus sp. THM7-7]|nr:Fur-regulated basic protein FbpA [Sporolactobacillus sp. THM7-7]